MKHVKHITKKQLDLKDYVRFRNGYFAEVSIDKRFLIGRRSDGVLFYLELDNYDNDLSYSVNHHYDIVLHNGVMTMNFEGELDEEY